MAFAPSSVVYLCNVDFDNGYKHVRYFPNEGARNSYFSGRVVRTFTEYLTVRKNKPDGGFVSSIKVGANIDDLMSHCNYMYYQNAHHGNRLFFAFITDFLYVNENTTEIVFETDVFQTWFHSVQIKPSFVVREHCATNGWKDNTVPEKFDVNMFEYEELETVDKLNKWGYLVGATHYLGDGGARGGNYSGIYQGMYFYFFTDTSIMNSYLDRLEEDNGDCIQFIALVPTFCVSQNTFDADRAGILGTSSSPASADIGVPAYEVQGFFGGVHCFNNKLQTYPYTSLIVTNHNNEESVYKLEDFESVTDITFTLYGDVSASPSVTLIPRNYQGIDKNFDCGASISAFPQCAFNSDTFKLWLSKNGFGMAANVGSAIVKGAVGGGVVGGPVGAVGGAVASGAAATLNAITDIYSASKEPNRYHAGSSKDNLRTAMKFNKFHFYVRKIKPDAAKRIDDYFTMFGYQTNEMKVPNLSSRPFFNYVETVDINIVGAIPNEDMKRLKRVFNEGVTLWKSNCDVGDYSVDNLPS